MECQTIFERATLNTNPIFPFLFFLPGLLPFIATGLFAIDWQYDWISLSVLLNYSCVLILAWLFFSMLYLLSIPQVKFSESEFSFTLPLIPWKTYHVQFENVVSLSKHSDFFQRKFNLTSIDIAYWEDGFYKPKVFHLYLLNVVDDESVKCLHSRIISCQKKCLKPIRFDRLLATLGFTLLSLSLLCYFNVLSTRSFLLHYSIKGNSVVATKALLAMTNPGEIPSSSSSIGYSFAEDINPDLLKCLLENGYNINAADGSGRTVLHRFAGSLCGVYSKFYGTPDSFRLLLYNGASPFFSENHIGVPSVASSAASWLIEYGNDPSNDNWIKAKILNDFLIQKQN